MNSASQLHTHPQMHTDHQSASTSKAATARANTRANQWGRRTDTTPYRHLDHRTSLHISKTPDLGNGRIDIPVAARRKSRPISAYNLSKSFAVVSVVDHSRSTFSIALVLPAETAWGHPFGNATETWTIIVVMHGRLRTEESHDLHTEYRSWSTGIGHCHSLLHLILRLGCRGFS